MIRFSQLWNSKSLIRNNYYLYSGITVCMTTHQRKQLFVYTNLFGYLGMLVTNGLANVLPINGKTTGMVADSYPNLFAPAGITFAIWGLIYTLLAVFLIYSLIALHRREITSSLFIVKVGWWFFITCLLNVGWILAWHYELIWLSLIIMLLLLSSLIVIYRRLDIGGCCAKAGEKVFVFSPFSLYLGWISIATIANVTIFLVDIDWNRFGLHEVFWAILMIAFGTALTLYLIIRHVDVVYGIAVAWAFAGIMIKRVHAGGAADRFVWYAAVAGLILLLTVMLFQILRGRAYR